MITIKDPSEDSTGSASSPSSYTDTSGEASEDITLSSFKTCRESSNSHVAPIDGSPSRKTKLLSNVYNTCTFAPHVVDPLEFREVVKLKEWHEAA